MRFGTFAAVLVVTTLLVWTFSPSSSSRAAGESALFELGTVDDHAAVSHERGLLGSLVHSALRASPRADHATASVPKDGVKITGGLTTDAGESVRGFVDCVGPAPNGTPIGGRLLVGSQIKTDDDGRFRYELEGPFLESARAGRLALLGFAPWHGTAFATDLDPSEAALAALPLDGVVLRVRGHGALRGVVVDAHGLGVPCLALHAPPVGRRGLRTNRWSSRAALTSSSFASGMDPMSSACRSSCGPQRASMS